MKTHVALLSVMLLGACSGQNGTSHAAESSKASNYPHAQTPSSTTTTPAHPGGTTAHATDTTKSHTTGTATNETDADRHLVEQVRKALAESPSTAPSQNAVQVTAQSGTVTLRGEVASADTKTTIEKLVESVPGVQKVDDELVVKTG